jgi:hypothetical protein
MLPSLIALQPIVVQVIFKTPKPDFGKQIGTEFLSSLKSTGFSSLKSAMSSVSGPESPFQFSWIMALEERG